MAYSNFYETGTVTVTAGGTALTGIGTAWVTAGVVPGAAVFVAGHSLPLLVRSVTSETAIVLDMPAPQAATGADYVMLTLAYDAPMVELLRRLLNQQTKAFDLDGEDKSLTLTTDAGTVETVYATETSGEGRFRFGLIDGDLDTFRIQRWSSGAWADVFTVARSTGVVNFQSSPLPYAALDHVHDYAALDHVHDYAALDHVHEIGDVAELQGALDAKLASASYTASDVLTKLKTVDGTGSGLDADTVQGVAPSAFGLARISDPDQAAAQTALGITTKAGLRNRHLNPAFQICQDRATGATVVMTSGGDVMDGVTVSVVGGGELTCSQVLKRSPGGSPYRSRFAVSTADAAISVSDSYSVNLPIEGVDVADLAFGTPDARPFVWRGVITAPAGTYHIAFRNASLTRSYVVPVIVSPGEADTDKLVTVTVPGDTTGTWVSDASGIGIRVSLVLAVGATYQTGTPGAWQAGNHVAASAQSNGMASTSNIFEICDIGLYAGTEVPAYEVPDYADDLSKCQRYFVKTASHPALKRAISFSASQTTLVVGADFPCTMRATPAMAVYGDISDGAETSTWPGGITVTPDCFSAYQIVPAYGFVDLHYYIANARL